MSALLTTPCERKQQQIVQTQSLNGHQGVFAGNPSWFLRFTIQLHLQVVFVKCLMVKRWERGKNARNASSGRAAFPHLLMLPSAPWHWVAQLLVSLVDFFRVLALISWTFWDHFEDQQIRGILISQSLGYGQIRHIWPNTLNIVCTSQICSSGASLQRISNSITEKKFEQ